MDVNGGQIGNQTAGNPIWPGTFLTGPILAGNVLHSDGSGNLAATGGSNGVANVGYVEMVQVGTITQTASTVSPTPIVIPAQSMITGMRVMVTTAFTGGNTTFGIGIVGNTTYFTAAGSLQGNATGLLVGAAAASPGNVASAIANWDNVGPTDVQIAYTSGNTTGNGTATVSVSYVQGVNNSA